MSHLLQSCDLDLDLDADADASSPADPDFKVPIGQAFLDRVRAEAAAAPFPRPGWSLFEQTIPETVTAPAFVEGDDEEIPFYSSVWTVPVDWDASSILPPVGPRGDVQVGTATCTMDDDECTPNSSSYPYSTSPAPLTTASSSSSLGELLTPTSSSTSLPDLSYRKALWAFGLRYEDDEDVVLAKGQDDEDVDEDVDDSDSDWDESEYEEDAVICVAQQIRVLA